MTSHLVGIGGTGMSALAEWLADQGETVTGSDRFLDAHTAVPALTVLQTRGLPLFPQDGSGIGAHTDRIIVSTAIEPDNPDIRAAEARNIPVVHRARALADAIRGHDLVAVAGTSGKSTTTAMLGHILHEAGLAPSVVNGAPCLNWAAPDRTGAVLAGSGSLCVAEVDESDRSLLAFSPRAALVLNASADHFPLDETQRLFDAFLARVSGPVLDARALPPPEEISEDDWSVSFRLDGQRLTLPLPGAHNAIDAACACRLALALGVPAAALAPALAGFRGVARRLQLIGVAPAGFHVVDDYAHNTEKIRACLHALQRRARHVFAIWRPHGYAPLRKMSADLVDMFAETLRPGDRLLLLPVFDAGGTAVRNFCSGDFARLLVARGVPVTCLTSLDEAAAEVRAAAGEGDFVVTLGARDPALPRLAQSLVKS